VLLFAIACSRFVAGTARWVDLVANVSYFVLPIGVLTVIILIRRRRILSSLIALAICVTAYLPLHPVVRVMWRGNQMNETAAADSPNTVSILVTNVNGSVAALDQLINVLKTRQPDLVAVIEAGQETGRSFVERDEISVMYPFRIPPDINVISSIVILSRLPVHEMEFEDDPAVADESLYAFHHSYLVDYPVGGNVRRFIFTAAHPPSPRTDATWKRGNEKTLALAEFAQTRLAKLNRPIILAGDFNSTMTGYQYGVMRRKSGLVSSDVLIGGITGTWPAEFPGLFRLTLDRLWVSPESVRIIDRRVLDEIASDHRPALFTCVID